MGIGSSDDDFAGKLRDLERRLYSLETSPRATNTSVRGGAFIVLDANGVEQVRLGSLPGGGYGARIGLGVDVDNVTGTRNVVGFGDLTTGLDGTAEVGPIVSVHTGTRALVIINARIQAIASHYGMISYAITPTDPMAANTDVGRFATIENGAGNGGTMAGSAARVYLQEGLTPGINTFTMKYSGSHSSGVTFGQRSISVLPI